MIQFYEAFNLKIRSDNLLIPELNPVNESKDFEILIRENLVNFEGEDSQNIYNTKFIKFHSNKVILKVNNICLIKIENGEKIYWQRLNNNVQEEDVRTFLLGTAIGSLLIQRGLLVLHGNALEKNGKAIVCLGHSGTGKSTIAYSLMQQGWNLISDDLVAINNDRNILPGIPRIKLWKDAALSFKLDISKLKPLRKNLKKYTIHGSEITSTKKCFPLHAIYLLERDNNNVDCSSNIKNIEIKSEKVKLIRLKNQLYRSRFVKGLGKERDLFFKLVNLQRKVPLVKLPIKNSIDNMDQWLNKNDLSNSDFWVS